MSLATAQLVGNLTRDVELRQTPSGSDVAGFSLAVDSGFGDRKVTGFMDCAAFGKLAGVIGQHCRKGQTIAVAGELRFETFKDRAGNDKAKWKLVVSSFSFVGARNDGGNKQDHSDHRGSRSGVGQSW